MSSAIFFSHSTQIQLLLQLQHNNKQPHPLALIIILLGFLTQQNLAGNSEIVNINSNKNSRTKSEDISGQYKINFNNEYDYRDNLHSLNNRRNVEEGLENKMEDNNMNNKEQTSRYSVENEYINVNINEKPETIKTKDETHKKEQTSRYNIENKHNNININEKPETIKKEDKTQQNNNNKMDEHPGNENQSKSDKNKPKSRQKRVLWLTEDGRLALPPGTTMVITPSLSMPFVRYPPEGFFSNLTVSLPFTIDFNKLGLTDNENPYGVLPPVLARSMGRAAGGILANYIGSVFEHRRSKRSPESRPPAPPSSETGHFHGGERALLYVALEELLENFGLDGRACLLRAICEVHAHPMKGFGLVGEILKLFLSASKSPYSDLMKDYVEAENAGRGGLEGHGECWPYMKDCPKSLFLMKHNKYSDEIEDNEVEPENFEFEEQHLEKDVTYYPNMRNM